MGFIFLLSITLLLSLKHAVLIFIFFSLLYRGQPRLFPCHAVQVPSVLLPAEPSEGTDLAPHVCHLLQWVDCLLPGWTAPGPARLPPRSTYLRQPGQNWRLGPRQ